jgi:hypothetical protein
VRAGRCALGGGNGFEEPGALAGRHCAPPGTVPPAGASNRCAESGRRPDAAAGSGLLVAEWRGLPAVRSGQWPDRERQCVRGGAWAGQGVASVREHISGVRDGVAERLRPRLPASVFVPLTAATRALRLRVVIDGRAGAVLLDKTASFRLRHVADAACPEISSYRASATVSRGGAIGTR